MIFEAHCTILHSNETPTPTNSLTVCSLFLREGPEERSTVLGVKYLSYHYPHNQTRYYRVLWYQLSVHGVTWPSLVKDTSADTASSMQKWTMTYQKQNGIETNVMNSVMAFSSSAPIRLHSVSPSFLF
jgi:hypothetical protein